MRIITTDGRELELSSKEEALLLRSISWRAMTRYESAIRLAKEDKPGNARSCMEESDSAYRLIDRLAGVD